MADHLRGLFVELGVEGDVYELMTMRREWTKQSLVPRADALATLEELRQRGHQLGLISVCSQEVPEVWEETPFAGGARRARLLRDVGISKPDPRIYEIACERLDIEPGESCSSATAPTTSYPGPSGWA